MPVLHGDNELYFGCALCATFCAHRAEKLEHKSGGFTIWARCDSRPVQGRNQVHGNSKTCGQHWKLREPHNEQMSYIKKKQQHDTQQS